MTLRLIEPGRLALWGRSARCSDITSGMWLLVQRSSRHGVLRTACCTSGLPTIRHPPLDKSWRHTRGLPVLQPIHAVVPLMTAALAAALSTTTPLLTATKSATAVELRLSRQRSPPSSVGKRARTAADRSRSLLSIPRRSTKPTMHAGASSYAPHGSCVAVTIFGGRLTRVRCRTSRTAVRTHSTAMRHRDLKACPITGGTALPCMCYCVTCMLSSCTHDNDGEVGS